MRGPESHRERTRSGAELAGVLRARYGVTVRSTASQLEWPDGAGLYFIDQVAGPAVVVRRSGSARPFERVVGDGAVLAYLEANGILAERVVPALDGALAVRDGETSLLVTVDAGGTPAVASADHFRQLGAVLGQLHDLRPPADDRYLARRAGSTPLEDLRVARSQLQTVSARAGPHQRSERDALQTALDATSECEDCPTALVHPDAHLGNALIDEAGDLVLVDWVGAGRGPRIASLGWALYDAGLRSEDGIEAVLDGWCSRCKPTSIELDRLGDAIRFRPLTHAVRSFAAAIAGEDDQPRQWDDRYQEADAFAARARQILTR